MPVVPNFATERNEYPVGASVEYNDARADPLIEIYPLAPL